MAEYSMLMQKMKDGSAVKDSLTDFGIVCTDAPFMPFGEVKELASNDWPDEDGEDTYIPAQIPLASYDMEIGLAYKGGLGSCYTKIKAFRDYLTGRDNNGGAMKVYLPYPGIGRQNVYFKSMTDWEFDKSDVDEVLTATLTLRVTDPVTDVILNIG